MVPNPYPVIPSYPMADISQAPMPPPPVIPPPRTSSTPGAHMQMPSAAAMPVPEPAPPPVGGPVIPPPPMMEPSARPRTPVIPIYPNVQEPQQPVIPPNISSPGQTPLTFASADTPRERGSRTHAGRHSTRPRWSRLFERPPSLHFVHNPLPDPPRSIIEHGHYAGLIQRLREDPGEILRAKTAATGGTYIAFVSQAPGQPAVIPRSMSPPRPKQSKGGIFRSLSNAFSRKSRKGRRGESSDSTLPPIRERSPMIYAPALPTSIVPHHPSLVPLLRVSVQQGRLQHSKQCRQWECHHRQ